MMANKIKPKRSYTANAVPTTSDLDTNELAIRWDLSSPAMFTKNAAGNIVSVTLGGSGGGSGSVTIPASGDQYWENVSLALKMQGVTGSTSFTDSSIRPKAATVYSTATISTAQSKFGGSSGLFNGSSDYISFPADSDFNFGSGDFTIEAWIYQTANAGSYAGSSAAVILGQDDSTNGTSSYGWTVSLNPAAPDNITFTYTTTAGDRKSVSVTSGISLNSWTHVSISRNANKIYLFVNGVLKNSGGTTFTDTLRDSTTTLKVGGQVFDGTYKYFFPGYIDDLIITKGVGRRTATFTPSTETFQTSYTASQTVTGSGSSGGMNAMTRTILFGT